jgi:N-acetylmuramoyl-L-alanine amidase CwlA
MKNLVELTIYLMKKYNIDINHVVRHFDISAKWCPRPFMGMTLIHIIISLEIRCGVNFK